MATKKNNSARAARNKPVLMDIRTVAERANVSIATVSRTINHVPTVNAKMAKRVWEAIRELNYFPNTQARALVSGRSQALGPNRFGNYQSILPGAHPGVRRHCG